MDANSPVEGGVFARRARGGVGLMVTGGVAPNRAGWVAPMAAKLSTVGEMKSHRVVADMVHEAAPDAKLVMQILHSGRYGYHPLAVAPSAVKSPIGWFTPHALSTAEVHKTVEDYGVCAGLAQEAGYDGVEVMGSEGYLINQFLVTRTNKRDDEYGGDYANRMKFPVEIVRRVREVTGPNFIIIYRLSMLDLVEGGSTWEEIVTLAKAIEAAGATIINTGIGWHEARVPTIVTSVPRAAFSWVTQKMMKEVNIPLCTTNRINMPHVAEKVLQDGHADMISMARPFLADPDFVNKAQAGLSDEINTCIGCNQACLDHTFKGITASCLVNPEACHEDEFVITNAAKPEKIAVVGAGPAGLAFATTAAARGHNVSLFDQAAEIGGQFNMAKVIPGKEEFYETIRYYGTMLKKNGVDVKLNTRVEAADLAGFDKVIMATGISPRTPDFPGVDHPKVMSYIDVLRHKKEVGQKVAIIGAGGIGFDVAEFLVHDTSHGQPTADEVSVPGYMKEWGVDMKNEVRSGLIPAEIAKPQRDITLLQRKSGKLGAGLGKTSGWVHRANLQKMNVNMIPSVSYDKVDDSGLHITITDKKGKKSSRVLDVDNVILCAGQTPLRELEEPLKAAGVDVFRVGGAEEAGELDAKKAIDMATRLAIKVEDCKPGDVFTMDIGTGAKMIEYFRNFRNKKEGINK
jgi:2,4-dienoyl-CoA reductase (NADPH2)